MTSFKFPTRRERGPGEAAAEVIDVYEGYNAQYGPKGSDGLYVKIRYDSGKTRDIFYPQPPRAKSDKLIEALDELQIDLDQIGWGGLIGYRFRWVTETVQLPTRIKETGKQEMRSVQLEYPAEIIEAPAPQTQAETTVSADGQGDWEAFLDDVLIIADGKSEKDMRLSAATSKTIRSYPEDFRVKLNRGEAVASLKEQGRLNEDDQGLYHAVLEG